MLQEQVCIFQELGDEADHEFTLGQRSLTICSLEQNDGATSGTYAGAYSMSCDIRCQGQCIRACAMTEWVVVQLDYPESPIGGWRWQLRSQSPLERTLVSRRVHPMDLAEPPIATASGRVPHHRLRPRPSPGIARPVRDRSIVLVLGFSAF
ncbi:hypothetical protein M441DRAFT_363373 [Trichoderma asperellum CBS 433.97]|uniref:Uncharacterized protein n=1 Tax=Trichoderma asperellum (strain ATCC 204424 / CBS 433.97 / NBRC 101777) TaxID=1042311 RepID=A0A2T3ZDY5_TRIA4|nr:hypothetical protein M441DRAFT_363373 [Trichoderma asperellum CBS 433.97]PTB43016.1 hypothetical protein M441DRAFT_363373 [Trichoderma asperellum CBS 433.97]